MTPIQTKEENSDDEHGLGYQNTLMYGRYQRDLGEVARQEARRLRRLQRRRLKDDKRREKELNDEGGKLTRAFRYVWSHSFARLGEDWVFLALLGIIMAVLSFVMDRGISACNNARIWMFRDLAVSSVTRYLAWVSLPICLILFSAGFVHIVAPQSIGSGIPEMKTILRGVQLQEYLTFRTLVAKVIGLTATLGSGMPLGKEGPFVHIASIVATLLSKLVTSFKGIYANESRTSEMLAAACAAGVAACFAAPIGGVLFSIEVTTTYFAVRNYWRGFFAACCGATVFKLLAVWSGSAATVTAMFQTNYQMEFPFDPQELIIFALIGVISGLVGALWVLLHRKYVLFMRNSKQLNQFLQKNRFIYPGIVALFVSTVTFPLGLGQYMAGDLNTHEQVTSLFANFTWSGNLSAGEAATISHWTAPGAGVFLTLVVYIVSLFILSIIASTIPVPSGIFIPAFKMGAALGRLVGEITATAFPMGVAYGGLMQPIIPGGYACVGAAAVSGAVTHTVSTIVIMFEMTGQVTHIVPTMTAVLIANAVAALFQPSAFDSIILIKKLPYLPELLSSASGLYNLCVEDFMVRDVKYIWNKMTFQQLKDILKENKSIRSFPLVDSPTSMVLLGSIQRPELVKLLDRQVGRERRMQIAAKWQKEAEEQRKKEEEQKKRQRRPSRFEVCPAPDILHVKSGNGADDGNLARGTSLTFNDQAGLIPSPGSLFRPKSILKKTNSFTMMRPIFTSGRGSGQTTPTMPHPSVYSTVTGAESRIRMAFEAIFKKSTTLQDVDSPTGEMAGCGDVLQVPASPNGVNYGANVAVIRTPSISKKVQLPHERVCDMSGEEQGAWEHEEMSKEVHFGTMLIFARRRLQDSNRDKECDAEQHMCHIDPAPFQLVERTTLLKVHSLFSTLGVSRAYVTSIGRLIGVVALKELRKAIEDVNNGVLVLHDAGSELSGEPESVPLTQTEKDPSNA